MEFGDQKGQIFTRDNSEKQMRNSIGSLSHQPPSAMYALKHRFLSFGFFPTPFPSAPSSARRTSSPVQRHTPECKARPPRTNSPLFPSVHGLQFPGCNAATPTSFHTDKEEKIPRVLGPERSLLAYLGAPGALQNLLG